jgi:hypothetical protein
MGLFYTIDKASITNTSSWLVTTLENSDDNSILTFDDVIVLILCIII